MLQSRYRSHTCQELSKSQIGQDVRLSGWLHQQRDHGQVVFLDLRDHYGLTQIVVGGALLQSDAFQSLCNETVIYVEGKVVERSAENINPNLSTGQIEVVASNLEILSKAKVLPFVVNKEQNVSDSIRLKNRFLDLRTQKLHENIILRSKVCSEIRAKMTSMGFHEFHTPILTSSSPEGARDYLVPSRVHPGKFYALPQAPQQFKQLLMVAGFDRYFQIAPCFRDEDARADRSPGEFYQLDVEMSFVEQEDIFQTIEEVTNHIFEKFGKFPIHQKNYPRIPYREAMLKFGSDKPDLRIPYEIQEATELFRQGPISKLSQIIEEENAKVRILRCPGIASSPRKVFDDLVGFVKDLGAFGMMYLSILEDGSFKGPLAKFAQEGLGEQLMKLAQAHKGDTIFLVSGEEQLVAKVLGHLRNKLADDFDLREKNIYKFCWIVDFPMYEKDDEGKIEFSHNPFSMPQGGMKALEEKDPLDILAFQYDIVCNGVELSSGAIRNHLPEVMYKAFSLAGYGPEVVEEKFSGMINAFKHGAPPHGGIAPGLDRMVMLLADEPNIREVIAFPMTSQAEDLMMAAPSNVSEKQLKELHIKLDLPPSKE